MNKNQKTIIVIMLLVMAIILIYPPTEYRLSNVPYDSGREFIFSLKYPHRINVSNLIAQLLVVLFLGGSLTILFGLKKKKK